MESAFVARNIHFFCKKGRILKKPFYFSGDCVIIWLGTTAKGKCAGASVPAAFQKAESRRQEHEQNRLLYGAQRDPHTGS